MKEYIIVAWLKPPKETLFKRTTFPLLFPLHMTVVGTFYPNISTEKIVDILNGVCATQKLFTSHGKSRELYGPNLDVPVTTVERTEEIHTLHKQFLKALGLSVRLKVPKYNNESYSPHISDAVEGAINPGDKLSFNSISLVELKEQELEIEHTWNL